MLWAVPGRALADQPPIAVRYLGPAGPVRQALGLATSLSPVADIQAADVTVLNDTDLSPDEARRIGEAVRAGTGLVLIMGPRVTSETLAELLGQEVALAARDEARSLQSLEPPPPSFWERLLRRPVARKAVDPLLEEINWRSAPQVLQRSVLSDLDSQVLVQTYQADEPVVARLRLGQGTVYLLSVWLSGEANGALVEWPYFNYLVYHLAVQAAGATPETFADYPASPVPHRTQRRAVLALVAVMLATTVTAFLLVRRYSLRHPEALERISIVSAGGDETQRGWEEIGFHRPLAGFLVLLAMGLLLFIPFMIYQTMILPRFLLPSAQALGAWSLIINFFNTFWILFDMGTSVAFIKYFSEFRVNDPRRGLKYVQLFVWWQALTGTLQLGVVAILAAYVIPHTAAYAYLSYYIIFHALIQFPGFLRVFQYVFRAFQRLDYDQILNIMAQPAPGGTGPGSIGLLLMLLQAAALIVARRWAAGQPIFGPAMGGAFGLGLGLYLTELSIFLTGLWLYHRLGYRARVIFLAHFDRQTVWSALRFGVMITAGGVMGALGWTIQVLLMERSLLNYAEIQGIWNLAAGLIVGFQAMGALYQGLMPGLSEAFSHGRLQLSRYYVAQGFKYGGWFSAFIGSALLAVGDRFILGAAGPGWERAAQIVGILVIWGSLQFPAWFSDQVQQGVGKPSLQALMLLFEQSLRVVLMIALLGRFQMWGLVLAYLIALPTKDVVAWLVNARLIFRPNIYWWQTLAAPLLGGAVNYVTLRALGALIWRGDMGTSLLLFFVAILPSLPWYCFWNGFFGGWDTRGLAELRRAARISHIARPIAVLIYQASAAGARFSPWHGRFPITLYRGAMSEARSLTAEKVAL